MSLAMTAAPLDSNDNHTIGQKRKIIQQQQQVMTHNKTKKKTTN